MAKIYVADKDTLDSVKETAEATSEKVDGVHISFILSAKLLIWIECMVRSLVTI